MPGDFNSGGLVHHFLINYTFSLVCIPDCCVVFPLRCHRIAVGKTPCSAEIHTSRECIAN